MRRNLAGPFVQGFLDRAKRNQTLAAERVDVTRGALNKRIRGDCFGLAPEKLETIICACGATAEDVEILRAMCAIDAGTMPIPESAKVEHVRSAMRFFQAISSGRVPDKDPLVGEIIRAGGGI